jgi:diacylglycerol kinase (ATP)
MGSQEKIIIILNGVSRKKKKFYQEILPGLSNNYLVEVLETQYRDHAMALGKEAAIKNPNGILAAGGDGTLNQVLNGVMSSGMSPTPVGIIPLGTGNDFARMENIKPTSESILKRIAAGPTLTDIGRVNCLNENGEKSQRYFINVASLGMGPDVVKRLFKSDRSLGPTLTYFKAITQTFFSHKPEEVEATADHWTWRGKLRVLAIANGQSFGSALYVAPDAKPDDGLFSTFIAGEIPLIKFLWLLQAIKSKKTIKDNKLHYDVCTKLSLTSTEKCWIETEGELAGMLPATVEILPKAIKFFR